MAKFKVGEKVRLVGKVDSAMRREGVIRFINDSDSGILHIESPYGTVWNRPPEALEHIEPYLKRQQAAGFKKGDLVKVLCAAKSFEDGWDSSWTPAMDQAVGGIFIVAEDPDDSAGVGLKTPQRDYWFPYFVLEKVEGSPQIHYKLTGPLTANMLLTREPCSKEFNRFVRRFGFSDTITEEALNEALETEEVWRDWLLNQDFIRLAAAKVPEPPKPVRKVGQIYYHPDGTLYILAQVMSKQVCLIIIKADDPKQVGNRAEDPVAVNYIWCITEGEWERIAGYKYDEILPYPEPVHVRID